MIPSMNFNQLVHFLIFGVLRFFFLILLIPQLTVPAYAQGQVQNLLATKNILVLHALEANMPLNVRTDRAIMAALEGGGMGMKNQYLEYLDLQRNPDVKHRQGLAEMMRLRYGKRKIDIIITLYPEALEFLLKDCGEIFPDAPIVALYMAPGFDLPKTGRHIIHHVFRCDMTGTLEIALKLVPGAKRVYVVSGVHPLDKKNETQARQDFKKWEGKLDFRYLSDTPLEGMLAMVSSAPLETIIFYMAMTADITGKTYNPRDVAERLRQVSKGPVFGLYETLLEYGVVGGSIVSYGGIGTQAGKLALSILGIGSEPNVTSTILDVPGVPMFDWRQLRRWNLSAGALPKGSIVINRETTLWDFRYYIIAALVFCLLETALIIFLIVQRRRKKVAENSLRRKTEELDQFFNVSLDLLCIASTDGYFLRLNPTWEKILGHSREELMAKQFLDFVHPDDLAATQQAVSIQASQQQKVFSFENRYRCKDGTYRWLQWSSAPAGKLIYAAARDVTEHKLAEKALEERLQFERLLSNFSARFVNIPPDRVDSEIESTLKMILDFFQVDRCALLQTLPDKTSWKITHVAATEDVPPVPVGVDLPVSINPWAYDKLVRKREALSFSRLDDLPAEATVDKQIWTEWGIRSNVVIPISIGGPFDYVIAINSVKIERVWPEGYVPRLRLLGEILVNALERKQIRLQIDERLRFEGLISNLSAGFVNLPPNEVDSEINRGLRSISEFFDVNRCSIGLFSENGTQLARAFEYRSAGAQPAPESISKEQMPWYMERLIRGNPVVMSRVEDLPPEAEKERQLCLVRGMKSVLSIPMVSGGKTLGSCAFVSTHAERVWPEKLVQRFRSISDMFANILERRQTENMLRTSEEKFRQFFTHTPEYCYIISPDGMILDVNHYALKALGYKKEELVGKPLATIYAPESLPKMKELFERWKADGEINNEEMVIVTRNGEKRLVLLNVGALRNKDGAIVQSTSVQTDITELKRAEAEAFHARRELMHLERLSRMGELTASLAHELNQPLTSILSNARAALRFLQSDRLDMGELKEILQDIANDDKRAGDIIRNLRSMVKQEEGVAEQVQINDVLTDVVSLFRSEAILRNIFVEMDFANSLPAVNVNRVQIQQVMVNLMMNAAESMVSEASGNRKIILQSRAVDHHAVQVAVRDFGPGVKEEELDKIFDPFFTTKRSGLGMGLSLSRSIIEAHGGHIRVENNPGEGVTFYFDLPVLEKQ
jgi:two-component system, LuxR family, sensor kinase FixL